MNKTTKTLLTVGAVLVGGYFLWKTIAPMGVFQQSIYPTKRGSGITLYPSMAPIGGPYPSPTRFHDVTVF